jgi:hypothetical protein
LTANLYCKSLFGEAALANLSIELVEGISEEKPKVLTGHIRIRAKSQGMALSLGDKIGAAQKKKRVKKAVSSGPVEKAAGDVSASNLITVS